ncbi:MAG: CAP domain-containing protein [Candidatus Pacearchaeota archaeon]|nr:CAP domain-containing protein [Candidatus Pacearchaeota archaeon]
MRLFTSVALLLLAAVGAWYWQSRGEMLRISFEPSVVAEVVETILQERVLTPPPLRVEVRSQAAELTSSGVFAYTNLQRIENTVSPLVLNAELSAAAEAKVQDMFAYQYFAHVSPTGSAASDFVKEAGYDFLAIGENLALGSFDGDQDLVQAWMDSPGHRANILNTSYQEIGVAVVEGMFEGKRTWVGVQMFGLPASVCPRPDVSLSGQIVFLKDEIARLQGELEILLPAVEDAKERRSSQAQALISQYNELVKAYNRDAAALQSAISTYNLQVEAFNFCLGG